MNEITTEWRTSYFAVKMHRIRLLLHKRINYWKSDFSEVTVSEMFSEKVDVLWKSFFIE